MTLLCYYYVQIHIALHANRLRNFFRMFFKTIELLLSRTIILNLPEGNFKFNKRFSI